MSETPAAQSAPAAQSMIYQIPAMVNVHSHAFQRDLRGIGERPSGGNHDDFWSWRQAMFAAVAQLDPDSIYDVSLRAYREMVAAGYGTVGEFHYVHHQPDGTPYADPNAMAKAVVAAARDAGIQIVLLPAAYHRNGWRDGRDVAPDPGQRRFSDPDVETYLARVDDLRGWAEPQPGVSVGVVAHSVRAVPASWLSAIAAYAEQHQLVRHIHAHEQLAELAQCQAEHGCSPLQLLADHGFLTPRTTVIHATHITAPDLRLLARSRCIAGICPTTEANLGDGFAPVTKLAEAGVRIAIGSDSNVRLDPFEETRELESIARRQSQSRRALLHRYGDLWAELHRNGLASLGLAAQRPAQPGTTPPDTPAGGVAPLGDPAVPTIALDRSHPSIASVPEADLPLALATCASAAAVIA